VKTTIKGCYCDEMSDKVCFVCQKQQQREAELKVCEAWNWNCSPRECAYEAFELGWTSRQLVRAMTAFGFREALVQEVLYEFEIIAD